MCNLTKMPAKTLKLAMPWIKKLLPLFLSALILAFIIWQVPPPESLTTASVLQFSLIFIPLLLFLTFLINLIFKFLLRSLVISLGLNLLLVLKTLDSLNLVSCLITLVAIFLIAKSLKKPATKLPGLSKPLYQTKIPQLSKLKKQK